MSAVKAVAATAVAALLAAVGVAAGGPRWVAFHADRVSVSYPPGWYATSRPLTPVTSPSQVLAVASFPFPQNTRANGCEPAGTLAAMQPRGALVYVIEYGSVSPRDFPQRPAKLKLAHFAHYECFGPSYAITFRQAGRYFQVQLAFGRSADHATQATALRVLNTFAAR